jgi:predicted esterase
VLDGLREWVEDHAPMVKALAGFVVAGVLIAWWLYDPPLTAGPSAGPDTRVLILMHGAGAPKNDLKPLADELAGVAPKLRVVLVAGPHRMGRGRTWYPSFSADSQEEVDARLLEFRAEARAIVEARIAEALDDGVPASAIYVGGFSQGATVALDVVLNGERGRSIGGLVSLSGGALPLDRSKLDGRAALRAFVSHGESDGVLAPGDSDALAEALEDAGHDVEWLSFEGGHAIPPEVRQALGKFLAEPRAPS